MGAKAIDAAGKIAIHAKNPKLISWDSLSNNVLVDSPSAATAQLFPVVCAITVDMIDRQERHLQLSATRASPSQCV